MDDILATIRAEGLKTPRHVRTLMRTPRALDVKNVDGTLFFIHPDLSSLIVQSVKHSRLGTNMRRTIKLALSTDGVNAWQHHSKKDFFPISLLLREEGSIPFLAALSYIERGSKPDMEFFRQFVDQIGPVLRDGVNILDTNWLVEIEVIVADLPARSFIKCVKGHNALEGACEFCHAVGVSINHVTVHHSVQEFQKRTDRDFVLQNDVAHHAGNSPFLDLPLDMIMSFPIDYMHNVCLGVTKRMVTFMLAKPRVSCHLSDANKSVVNQRMRSAAQETPTDFQRSPRDVDQYKDWSASEFREFLLYRCLPALENVVSDEVFECWLYLSLAIHLLCRSIPNVNQAARLITLFRRLCFSQATFTSIFPTINIHLLSHLPECCDAFGPLDSFSAFAFESSYMHLKSLKKGRRKPLQEVILRTLEANMSGISHGAPSREYKKIKNCVLSTKKGDSYWGVQIKGKMEVCVLMARAGENLRFRKLIFEPAFNTEEVAGEEFLYFKIKSHRRCSFLTTEANIICKFAKFRNWVIPMAHSLA